MKTVFLTGATGNMGWAGFKELYKKRDRFKIRILARPSKKNIRKLNKYSNDPAVEIIWGDLTCYEDVRAGVSGADYVLHVGGMVSPAADYFPEKQQIISQRKHWQSILRQQKMLQRLCLPLLTRTRSR